MTELQSDSLEKALGRVIHAAGSELDRPILATVLFEGDDQGFRVVTADNHRIAVADLAKGDYADFGRRPVPIAYIPVVRAFLKVSKREVRLAVEDNRLTLRDGSAVLTVPVMDGTWPNYAKAIKFDGKALGVHPAYLVDAAKATKGEPALKIRKGTELTDPFVFEVDSYREAILGIRLD